MKSQNKNNVIVVMAMFVLFVFLATACSPLKKQIGSQKIELQDESSENMSVSQKRNTSHVDDLATDQENKPSIDIPTVEEIINTLCSDEFEGRHTFSKGNEQAGEYIANIFNKIGLEPLIEDSYFQPYNKEDVIDRPDYNVSETANNIVGYIKGRDSQKAIIISAHFDGTGIKEGKIHRSALDNASGVSALIKIAENLKQISKEKPFESNIIFCAFNGEEQVRIGSTAFVNQVKSQPWYDNMYNINIDCIGSKFGGEFIFSSISEYSSKLYEAFKSSMKKNNINLVEYENYLSSDHISFEHAKKANIIIAQEGLFKLIHKPTETIDSIDYSRIEKLVNAISDFIEKNDEASF